MIRSLTLQPVFSTGSSATVLRRIIFLAIIAFSLTSALTNSLVRALSNEYSGDFWLFYAAGRVWDANLDPYDSRVLEAQRADPLGTPVLATSSSVVTRDSRPIAYAYPPPATFLFGVWANLPVQQAFLVQLVINCSLVIASFWLLKVILSRYVTVGLQELALLAALANSGFVHGNVSGSQTSTVTCVLLFGTFLLASSNKSIWAGVALGSVFLKPSFLPLYVVSYAVKRNLVLAGVSLCTASALFLIPILVTGRSVPQAFTGFVHSIVDHPKLGSQNPAPDNPYSVAMLNLAPLVDRIFGSISLTSTIATLLLLLALVLGSLYVVARSQPGRDNLLDFGLVSTLTLVVIDHRQYDQFLLFPGILSVYIYGRSQASRAVRWGWLCFMVVIVLAICSPNDASVRISQRFPALLDNYAWRVIASYQTWASLALLGGLLWLMAKSSSILPASHVRDHAFDAAFPRSGAPSGG
jgi:glycosyl transferase family 87